ncbi:MAG: ABC transporter permease [Burkholderiales bacterium]|jgi:putative ABC transport system permease protein|nr:ABC transporter permease [Burkholderiales bacterium]
MIVRDSVLLALRAITAHRLRSFLTLAGIGVGIAAVILLTSIGEGIHRYMLSEFSQFGTNVIGIAPGKVKVGGGPPSGLPTSVRPLTIDDAEALQRVPNVVGVVPTAWGNAEVAYGGRTRRTSVYGVGSAASLAFNMNVRIGQFLPPEEPAQARALVVLGSTLKRELFGAENALGAKVRIGGLQFRVIGVLESKGQFIGIDLDDTAFIPAARALELFNREGLSEINLSYREGAAVAPVVQEVKRVLAARHGREDFTVTTQEEMLRTLSNILDILTMAVAALGSISLLVGSVGIVTIMTIAVAERTNEVGLMVALGAQRWTILGLFLGEAVVLAVLGGLLGLAAGLGLAQVLRLAVPALPVQTPYLYAALAVAVSALIGLVAGVAPALRAARLDPVEALRAE